MKIGFTKWLTKGVADNCHDIVHKKNCHDIVYSQL